jgi:hypothetical protein
MKCEFCRSEDQTGKTCTQCGAKLPETQIRPSERSDPFFYEGYVCYSIRDWAMDTIEIQFWLGLQLVERIRVTREVLHERIGETYDVMPFFWDLFLLAHGEKDVIEWQEKNKKHPATFLVTRKENPELEWMRGLSMNDLAKAAQR